MDKTIQLLNGSMIIGLSGWVNAGEASTLSVKYLIDKLSAGRLGEIASEKFYVYQLQRPLVVVRNGLVQDYQPPKNEIFCWEGGEEGKGLILLLGAEPHLDWPGYSQIVLDMAKRLGANRIYTLGGYLVDASLTTEPFVTGSSNNSQALSDFQKFGVEPTDYTGPTSIYSEILWRGKSSGVDVVSLWCAVPFSGQESDLKAVYTLVSKLTQVIGLRLDLEDLKQKAASFRAQIRGEAEERIRQLIGDVDKSRIAKRPSYFI